MDGNCTLDTCLAATVWQAQPVDISDEAEVCIKIVTVDESGPRDTRMAKNLLLSAAVQQAMAQRSSRWAPVLKLGSDGYDAFAVTPRYPRSLQTLIDRRVRLESAQLQMILLEILQALIELETEHGLAHGNLKPSNVFLTSPTEIREKSIRLSDPDALADTVPVLTRSFDIRSAGQILFALVTHKSHANIRSPLIHFQPWKCLGPSARKWFNLCDQMLKTPSRPGVEAMQQICEQVSSLKTTRRRLRLWPLFS